MAPDNCVLYYREKGSYIDIQGMKDWIKRILAPLQRKIHPGKGVALVE